MMNNNGRPLSRKQTVRLLVALTILAWATQTLLKQWGFSAEIQAAPTTRQAPVDVGDATSEKFVPSIQLYPNGATLELRSEATVVGQDVKLRQICRWSDRDKSFFEPVGDLVLTRLGSKAPFKAITLQDIREVLRDAGVNTAAINFAGSASCTVSRSDVEYSEKNGLQQWIEAKEAARATTLPASEQVAKLQTPTKAVASPAAPATHSSEMEAVRTLRSALILDLANRLNVSPDLLQVSFKQTDEKVLNISEPLFKYVIEPSGNRALGNVAWNVTINSAAELGGAASKKLTIAANAKLWQEQVVAVRPIVFKQIIRNEDVMQRRTLVENISDEPMLTIEQTVGQQAARELKPMMVLTGKMIDPVQLVKTGQFVTVTLEQGSVQLKTVVRAMEPGSLGQTIRVKNEATRDIYQVVLTGPQTATLNLSAPVASAPRN